MEKGRVHIACHSAGSSTNGRAFLPARKNALLVQKPSSAQAPVSTEPYKLTPVFIGVAVALLVSYIALWAFPDEPYVFATMTNLCYIAAALQREVAAFASYHSVSYLVGLLGSAPYVLVLLGSASLAYHRQSLIGSWTHQLDIFFGMLLVFHVFYVSFSVVILRFAGRFVAGVRTILAMVFTLMVFVLMFWFDDIYKEMLLFYLVFGPGAAVFGIVLRFFLTNNPDGDNAGYVPVRIAIAEMVTLLLMVFAAIFAQCELIGVKYTVGSNPVAYDFYHGQWHFLLAISMSALYSRAADAARRVRNKKSKIWIKELSTLDWVGLGIGFVYALLVIVLKESQVELSVAKVVLSVVACLYGAYGLFALWYHRRDLVASLFGTCCGTLEGSKVAPESAEGEPLMAERV